MTTLRVTDPLVSTAFAEEPAHRAPALPLRYLVAGAVAPLVLLVLWGALLLSRGGSPAGAIIGAQAPAFALADLDGNPVRLADLRGRPVIVNFWASSCGPCVEEFPMLSAALERHASEGLAIVGIVYRDRSESAREFMTRFGATWPAVMDPAETVAARYGVVGPPESYFIGRDGLVAGRQIGQLTQSDLDRQLAAILARE